MSVVDDEHHNSQQSLLRRCSRGVRCRVRCIIGSVRNYWSSAWNRPDFQTLNVAGETTIAVNGSGDVYRALVEINDDNDIVWYTGTGTGLAWHQFDLQSVILHELGHAVGGKHFSGSTYCSGSSYQTMCEDLELFQGNYYGRTLQGHETSDFKYAHP